MLSFLPRKISDRAVGTYVASFALVSAAFVNYAVPFRFVLLGLVFVCSFFRFSNGLTSSWKRIPPRLFVKRLFWTAFVIRSAWVVFSYYFYISNTGQPFEWGAADSIGYHGVAEWLAANDWSVAWKFWGGEKGVSDVGYPLYLTALYKVFGPSLIAARLVKALLGSLTCVMVYKLAGRTFGDGTGRLAAIFCLLMPNLIIYCGLHTKETEMVFCCVLFLERADYLLRSRRYSVVTILVPTLAAFSLFFFRTVLGAVAILSFFAALLFNSPKIIRFWKRVLLAVWMLLAVIVLVGGTIMTEIEGYWELRVSNEIAKRESQSRTAKWAKYATGTVMAPMVFVLPFSTMVDTGQQNQNVMHAGNFTKNFLGIFVIFSVFYAMRNKKWRDYTLIGAFTVGYLGIISFSGYANAERFHMPTLPCLLIMSAYGVSQLNRKNIKLVNYWCCVVVLMEVAWAYYKIGSRGLLD